MALGRQCPVQGNCGQVEEDISQAVKGPHLGKCILHPGEYFQQCPEPPLDLLFHAPAGSNIEDFPVKFSVGFGRSLAVKLVCWTSTMSS